jgi:hypothetical protein
MPGASADRIDILDRLVLPADHHAIAALKPPDAAGGADVDISDALLPQRLGAADIILIHRVAAVDDDIAALHGSTQRRHCILRDFARRQHHPDDARRGQLADHVLKVFRLGRALGRDAIHCLLALVIHHAFMAMLHEPQGNIAAHAAQADNADLHATFLFCCELVAL